MSKGVSKNFDVNIEIAQCGTLVQTTFGALCEFGPSQLL